MTDFQYTRHNDHIEITKYIGCRSDVTIPSTIDGLPVTSIGDSAFTDSENLTSVTIPDSVTSIDGSSFAWCRKLTEIHVS
ncbi:MAG: leucine-rich repeat protein, partial [Thermoguttaceae bacterium]|nr:leucine-rich repeat protein [Thermoguttaceae bacterium]